MAKVAEAEKTGVSPLIQLLDRLTARARDLRRANVADLAAALNIEEKACRKMLDRIKQKGFSDTATLRYVSWALRETYASENPLAAAQAQLERVPGLELRDVDTLMTMARTLLAKTSSAAPRASRSSGGSERAGASFGQARTFYGEEPPDARTLHAPAAPSTSPDPDLAAAEAYRPDAERGKSGAPSLDAPKPPRTQPGSAPKDRAAAPTPPAPAPARANRPRPRPPDRKKKG